MPRIIKHILLAIITVTLITCYSVAHPLQNAPEAPVVDSNVVKAQEVVYSNPVEEYIRLKFGVWADDAMNLLTNPACAENRNLDPLAVNRNYEWGGIGSDRGVFQINDIYHPSVTDECAFDYKCNIDYAWRMFENDNHTFVRWTCGRYLGI